MADVFDYALSAVDGADEQVDIDFDAELGYPESIREDRRVTTSDDEFETRLLCVDVKPEDVGRACMISDVTCYSPTQNLRPVPSKSDKGCACEVEGQEFCVLGSYATLACRHGTWRVEDGELCQSESCALEPTTAAACLDGFRRCVQLDQDEYCGNDPRN